MRLYIKQSRWLGEVVHLTSFVTTQRSINLAYNFTTTKLLNGIRIFWSWGSVSICEELAWEWLRDDQMNYHVQCCKEYFADEPMAQVVKRHKTSLEESLGQCPHSNKTKWQCYKLRSMWWILFGPWALLFKCKKFRQKKGDKAYEKTFDNFGQKEINIMKRTPIRFLVVF